MRKQSVEFSGNERFQTDELTRKQNVRDVEKFSDAP